MRQGREERNMEERLEMLEKGWEMLERKKRRRNIIIKGIRGVKKRKEELEGKKSWQILKGLEVEVKIIKIKRLEKGRREWGEMVMVKVGNEEEGRRVLENKKLRGGEIWIERHLAWMEKRIR